MNSRWSSTKLVVAALMAVAVVGCTDTTVQPKSTVTTANVFSDPNAYTQFIAKVYAGLATTGQQGPTNDPDITHFDEGFSEYLRVWWQLNELPTDEVAVAWGDPNLPEINTGQWDPANVWVYAMWSRIYFQVAMANEFLRQTTPAAVAARGQTDPTLLANIRTYRAEARFLRALAYYHGIDMFGDIPLVTEADQLGAGAPKQVARDSVYRYIVSELTAIQDSLPAPGPNAYARATKWADLMLLANLYLNAKVYTGTANYAGALTAASAVITGGGYQLTGVPYRNNFLADNNTSPEIIFAVPFDGKRTETWGGTTFLVHASCGGSMDNNRQGVNGCWWGIRMKPEAYYRYQTTPPTGTGEPAGDSRSAFFWLPDSALAHNDTLNNGQPAVTVAVDNISNFKAGIPAPKYSNLTSAGSPGSDGTFPDTDYPMFRLGEAYLIYIEAFLNGGGGTATQALTYFNALRERAYGNTNGDITAPQLDMQMLMDERGRELLWEGHRRTDLIRWGLFTTPSTYTWTWENNTQVGTAYPAYRALFPKPLNELSANPNLTQNTGY